MNIIKRINQISAQLDHVHPPSTSMAPLAHSRSINPHLFSTDSDTPPVRSLRPSASLIIIKPLQSTTPDGFNYHTLLIQRNSSQRSFASAHVFPGGNLDPDDYNHQFLTPKSTQQNLIPQDALKICAIRETFEESGILVGLANSVNNPEMLKNLRQKLSNQLTKFSNIAQDIQSQDLDGEKCSRNMFCLDQLTHFANILTPNVFPKGWDTHFYLTILSSPLPMNYGDPKCMEQTDLGDAMYSATPDGSETVSTVWLSPREALRRCHMDPQHHDWITVAPPQFYLLSDLAHQKDYRELTSLQHRMIPAFTPELVKLADDGVAASALTLPGDPLHSSYRELVKHISSKHQSFKHRIYVHNEPKEFGAQAGKFFRPLKAQRIGMETVLGLGWYDLN